MSRGSQSMYDRHITIFSPEGKLYQVEYAFRAVKNCNLTAIALRGKDTVCLVVRKKMPAQQQQHQDKLLDTTCITSLYNISDEIGGAMVGMAADCRAMVYRARQTASEFAHKQGYSIPVQYLAQKIANINQVYTQHAYMRLTACKGILIAYDEVKGPSIFRFDPAGWFVGHKACAAGAKEEEAATALEKIVRKKELQTKEEVVSAAIIALQTVMGTDLNASDMEVGVITETERAFRRMTDDEVDNYLTLIAERE